jgi:hypothetical protein
VLLEQKRTRLRHMEGKKSNPILSKIFHTKGFYTHGQELVFLSGGLTWGPRPRPCQQQQNVVWLASSALWRTYTIKIIIPGFPPPLNFLTPRDTNIKVNNPEYSTLWTYTSFAEPGVYYRM